MTISRLSPKLVLFYLLGALHSLSFAPKPLPTGVLPYLALICLTILLYQLNRLPTAKARIWPMFFFSFGHFTVGLYWIYISLHVYGDLSVIFSLAAVFFFTILLSSFYVATAVIHAWLFPIKLIEYRYQAFFNALLWASIWSLFEWVRGTAFTGFPWLNIGYAQVDGPLAGWAVLFGAYGVTWVAVFTAAAFANFFFLQKRKSRGALVLLISAFLLNLGGLFLHGYHWSTPYEDPFYIRLTQGNVPQSMKFDAQRFEQGVQTYYQLAAMPPKDPKAAPDIIVMPETFIPVFQNRLPANFWQQWIELAAKQNATLLMGLPLYDAPEDKQSNHSDPPSVFLPEQYTNSVVAIDAQTTVFDILFLNLKHRYDKHHLVPFGEFIPPGFKWFIDLLNIPLGEFKRGDLNQAPFALQKQLIAPDICYEDVFGEEIIRSVRHHTQNQPGATMLVNISNLGWFGDTWALRQHLQISRLRAIETARPMIRATNTGITAVIDPDGFVRAMLEQHTIGVLDVEVQGYTGQTPYVRWGNLPVLIFNIICIVFIRLLLKNNSSKGKP